MHATHSTRRLIVGGLVLALLASLFLAAPSSVRTSVASAQTCASGTTSSVFTGQSCSVSPFCSAASTYSCSPYGTSAYGCGYVSTYGCSPYGTSTYGCSTSLFTQACGGCGTSIFAAGCGTCGTSLVVQSCGATGGGSCTGIALQAGQSCSNGVVTCSSPQGGAAVPCAGAGIRSCPPTVITPVCTATSTTTSTTPTTAPRTALPSAGATTCPGGGYVTAGQSCAAAGGASGQPTAVLTAPQFGFQVSLASGWNLIAGPQGTTLTGVSGSLYTFQAGDTSYEVAPAASTPLKAGVGYWVNASQATQIVLPPSFTGPATVTLPAGQFVMIGNPGITTATVSGADTVLVYDPSTSKYTQTTQLQPGQGAWAYSAAGGQATITNAPAGQS